MELPNEIQSPRDFGLLAVDDLANQEENNENEVDEEALGVEEPHLARFVAQHQQRCNASDEQEEDCEEKNNLEDDFDKLVDCAGDQGKKTKNQ